MRGDADQVADVRKPEGKHFLAYQPLEDGEDKQHPVRS